MKGWERALFGLLALVLVGCATPQRPGAIPGQDGTDQPPAARAPSRITLVFRGTPTTLREDLNRAAGAQSVSDLEELLHVGLATIDQRRDLAAKLAESVPTIENGGWQLFPDGTMETTWRIRKGAQWHDGAPLTAEDVIFAAQVARDPSLPFPRDPGFRAIDGIDAPDPQTLTIHWREPFIEADLLFGVRILPLPRHVLEEAYRESRATFTQLPYWTSEFVGTGPYRLRTLERDSHAILAANEAFVLGRPRIDEIVVKFIGDANAAIANVLAGEAELTLSRVVSLEQAIQVRDQWGGGRMDVLLSGGLHIYPQFINPNPPIVADVRFRQAMFHALDRQQMVDSLLFGVTQVAHAFLSPDFPGYQEIADSVVRYEYDTRRAWQILEVLGFARGADGGLRDAAGQRLAVEIRSTSDDLNARSMLAAADYWQRLGLAVDPVVVVPQRTSDAEYGATFPAFFLNRQRNDLANLRNFRGSEAPVAETNFVGSNRARYRSPEIDALIDRFFVTIPKTERMQLVGRILRIMTEDLSILSVLYAANATLVSHRLRNATATAVAPTWNAHEWDVT